MPWGDLGLYGGLFLNAFIAATLLPALSEITLASLAATGTGQPLLLFTAATTGNVLGSVLNWWLGRRLLSYRDRRWFPFSDKQLEGGHQIFERFGYAGLLFAWLPIVGDPLTLVAGVLNARLVPFLLLVTLGKAARYGLVLWGVHAAFR
ncbi:YqaA family protein [Kordiimonas sp.]|uniref:YqaA family protein n=1 Tax=Kordiimonas sp. TaxID=1970157 RepID=UPI003A903652